MNCQSVESIISDSTRERFTRATVEKDVLLHASECERCKARLADELALDAGLRTFAESLSDERAPERVETSLLASFSEHHKKSTSSTPLRRGLRIPMRWAIAAAAAIVLAALAIGVSRMERAPGASPERAVEPRKESPKNDEGPQAPPKDVKPEQAPKHMPAPLHASRRKVPAQSPRPIEQPQPDATLTGGREITTDFMPLMQSDMPQLEGGQLLRIELPRSALASFGLPMNLEREGERIKADIVVGNDGLARAIRFVH